MTVLFSAQHRHEKWADGDVFKVTFSIAKADIRKQSLIGRPDGFPRRILQNTTYPPHQRRGGKTASLAHRGRVFTAKLSNT